MLSDDLETFDIAPFLHELCENIAAAGGAGERGIALRVEVDSVTVNLDLTIPLGLLR